MLRATCCVICGGPLPSGGRLDRRYCRKSCRAVAYRAGKRDAARQSTKAAPPGDGEVERTLLYTRIPREVLDVLARYFGQQREMLTAELAAARQRVEELEQQLTAEPGQQMAAALEEQRRLTGDVERLSSEMVATRSALTTQLESAQRQQREIGATLSDVQVERDEALRDLARESARAEELEQLLQDAREPDAVSSPETGGLLESLQIRLLEISAENERLTETARARQSDRDLELDNALERAQALEQEKTQWEQSRTALEGALALAQYETAAAQEEATRQRTLTVGFAQKLESVQKADKAALLAGDKKASDTIAGLRRESAHLRRQLADAMEQVEEARESSDSLSEDDVQRKGKGTKRTDTEAKLAWALAERDEAREDARLARAKLKKGEQQLAAKAQHIREALERSRHAQNTFTLAAHRYEGEYSPARDLLFQAKLDELMQQDELVRRQYIDSKRENSTILNPHLTTQTQAYALAMAERWLMFASPPEGYTDKVSWAKEGRVLDPKAELYLYKHSEERRADAWWEAFMLKPVEPKRRRRTKARG